MILRQKSVQETAGLLQEQVLMWRGPDVHKGEEEGQENVQAVQEEGLEEPRSRGPNESVKRARKWAARGGREGTGKGKGMAGATTVYHAPGRDAGIQAVSGQLNLEITGLCLPNCHLNQPVQSRHMFVYK